MFCKQTDLDRLIKDARQNKIVLFIGSGLSSPPFDSWSDFVEKSKKLAQDSGVSPNEISSWEKWSEAEILQAVKKKVPLNYWLDFCDKRFGKHISNSDISKNYRFVRSTGITQIVTTNYDSIPSLLWPDIDKFCNSSDEIATILRRLKTNEKYPFILKVHGCHTRPNTMVVTSEDYNEIIHNNKQSKDFLMWLFNSKTVLFLGFGLKDKHLDWILNSLKTTWKGKIPGSYAVMPNINDAEYERLLENYNIHALGYENLNNDHSGLKEILKKIFPAIETERVETGRPIYEEATSVQSADVSKLLLFPKAFPFNGRTRLIYTCRSNFENPSFKCPSRNKTLAKSKTVPTHIPVDELETLGLCLAWYGLEIFENKEEFAGSAIHCSENVVEYLKGNIKLPKIKGEIEELLMDNLIVIGENVFSNNLFYLMGHQLPWRHISIEETITYPFGIKEHRYRVKSLFKDNLNNEINLDIKNQLTDDYHKWGMITYAQNPFNPEKWILFLVGCHRSGQYLLLNWLRQDNTETLSKIIDHRNNGHDHKFTQIVVKGEPLEIIYENEICRKWSNETVKDISQQKNLPFFTNRYIRNLSVSKWGDPMADLSLLAKFLIEPDWMKSIKESLPQSLGELFEQEQQNGDIGFHVTLYEFLHTKGYNNQGFISELLRGKHGFLKNLKDNLNNLPKLHLTARQARVTPTSLQILVDIYMKEIDFKEYFKRNNQWHKGYINSMDLIIECCANAKRCLTQKNQNKLNIDSVPIPLHITLLRFNSDMNKQREDADNWAFENRRKIWGTSENLQLVLSNASEFPFCNIEKVDIN